MYQRLHGFIAFAFCLCALNAPPLCAADNYTLDPMHSAFTFKISHLGLSWVHGRFNDVSGSFAIDATNANNCTFALTVKAQSIDTGNAKRDEHLRTPDFFNIRQFPLLTFKSTAVKAVKDGYAVTGALTLHGVTRTTTFTLLGGQKAEFPKGTHRTGYSTELVLKRSDFGMDKMKEAIGEEVHIAISFEGVKK